MLNISLWAFQVASDLTYALDYDPDDDLGYNECLYTTTNWLADFVEWGLEK